MDRLTEEAWPKFRSSYPITDKHYLVTGWMSENSRSMGIYLADAFDNLVLLHQVEDARCWTRSPSSARACSARHSRPNRTGRPDATVYIQDIYLGPGLARRSPGHDQETPRDRLPLRLRRAWPATTRSA